MNGYDGKIVIGTEINTKQFEAQIKILERKLNDVEASLKMASEDKTLFSTREIEEMEAEAENLRNKIGSLQGDFKKTNKETSKGFDKGTKSLKRFALSLFSVGSIFAAVSKASSAYLSQNEELANKLQSVWIGLGSFLEPAISAISNVMLKGLGYLNEFIKALTGVDYIAKANAKALEKQTKAQAKLNKETQQYDFDVIRRQQNNSSSSGSDSKTSSGYIDVPELNQKLVSKLQNLAKALKENWYWIKEVGIILGLTFGAIKIAEVLGGIGKLLGSTSGTGLVGLLSIVKGLATIGVITIGVDLVYKALTGHDLVEDLKNIKKGIQELTEAEKNNTKQANLWDETTDKQNKKFLELYKSGKMTNEQMENWNKWMNITSETAIKQYNELESRKSIWGELSGKNAELTKQQEALARSLTVVTGNYEILYKQGKLNDTQQKEYAELLKKQIELNGKLGYSTEDLQRKYKDLTNEEYIIKIGAEDKTESVFDKIKKGLGNVGNAFKTAFEVVFKNGSVGSGGSRRFAQGGIVTQPTRALIGEAGYPEYVVPEREDYLSRLANLIGQYGSGGGNVTNVYLNGRLIQREMSKTQDKINFATNK